MSRWVLRAERLWDIRAKEFWSAGLSGCGVRWVLVGICGGGENGPGGEGVIEFELAAEGGEGVAELEDPLAGLIEGLDVVLGGRHCRVVGSCEGDLRVV